MMTRANKDETEAPELDNCHTLDRIPGGLYKETWVKYLIHMQKLKYERDLNYKLKITAKLNYREIEKIKAEKKIELEKLEISERRVSEQSMIPTA